MSLGLVIGDLRGCVFAGATGGYVSGAWAVFIRRLLIRRVLVHQPLICQPRGNGVKRKMAGSEESDKYKKKIFQKVGLFMIRHYL